MIGRISGVLVYKSPPWITVDCHGVGYDLEVPMSTYYLLPDCQEQICLMTHLVVREDAQLLYGFLTADERQVFRTLLKVSGIGARTALSILSAQPLDSLLQAIESQDSAMLIHIPGIGKKTAERLLLELKDKPLRSLIGRGTRVAMDAVPRVAATPPQLWTDPQLEALQALQALGYSEKEAVATLKQVLKKAADSDMSSGLGGTIDSTTQLIKMCLSFLHPTRK